MEAPVGAGSACPDLVNTEQCIPTCSPTSPPSEQPTSFPSLCVLHVCSTLELGPHLCIPCSFHDITAYFYQGTVGQCVGVPRAKHATTSCEPNTPCVRCEGVMSSRFQFLYVNPS